MRPTPPGWPRASSSLSYESAADAIAWLTRAFGFEVRLRVDGEGGKIEHSELVYGDAVFMLGDARREKQPSRRAPSELAGANTQSIMLYVDDIDAHFAQASAAGAQIVAEIKEHDYGPEYWTDRAYECVDLGGHHWYFGQRVRTGVQRAVT